MVQSAKRIIIIAGEPSGDLRAAGLASALLTLNPQLSLSGVGGECMQRAGVKCFADIKDLAVVGFVEVIQHYSRIKRVFNLCLEKVQSTKPDCVILVDYPGFNLRLAAQLKKRGVKVIYYISPQVWAWKEKRVETIKKVVDKMLVIFKFEEHFYAKHQMRVDYVGHPLVDEIQTTQTPAEVLKSLGLNFNVAKSSEMQFDLPFAPHEKNRAKIVTVGLLPGSRVGEAQKHLPILLETAETLYAQNKNFQFIILKSPNLPLALFERAVADASAPIKISTLNFYDSVNATDICIVASGTATLETALLQKPMVVIYKTSLITWALAKMFLKIKFIGLVNVVAGKQIVPECIQWDATPDKIADELLDMLDDKKRIDLMRNDLLQVKEILGAPGASLRAAEVVMKEIN